MSPAARSADSIHLTFLGAAGTVTGSRYLLEYAGRHILVDCGLFQGYKALRQRNWEGLPLRPAAIEAAVLTHAHLDHSGYLPRLVKEGFSGSVFASRGTVELCGILLPDSGHLQEEEANYANRKGFSKHRPALPLYTEDDARRSLRHLVGIPFNQAFSAAGFQGAFAPAGHILGASIVTLQAGATRMVFSGDLGRSDDPIMRPPTRIDEADYLIVESTYGNRAHGRGDPEAELGAHLARALARGGTVIMPAFAVGRAQALMLLLSRLKEKGAIPDVPVFLNSPMAIDATRLYHEFRAEHRLSVAQCDAACRVAQRVNSPEESRELNARRGPMVIISASGMATGGRVLHHLKEFAPDPKNLIVLPGFQAQGTRGAALAGGADTIKIHGDIVPVRAEVVQLDSMSAHADGDEIIGWLRGFRRPPRHTFVTHGEPAAAEALRLRIQSELGWQVTTPNHGSLTVLDP